MSQAIEGSRVQVTSPESRQAAIDSRRKIELDSISSAGQFSHILTARENAIRNAYPRYRSLTNGHRSAGSALVQSVA